MSKINKSDQSIDYYDHNKKRLNNPSAGVVNSSNDPDLKLEVAEYDRHPHDVDSDPHLGMCYNGKTKSSLKVDVRSLHTHEYIDPYRTIDFVLKDKAKGGQPRLFPERELVGQQTVEFYKHPVAWKNRMIAGDSSIVMNSLITRDKLKGQIQTIYFDPPYGIKYGSNFQPFVNNNNVQDGKDVTKEPEPIKAFRDTWKKGIHSYLAYMRDRLRLCWELLSDKGSIFVQIGGENFARVCLLLDEVFKAKNRVTMITYFTKGTTNTKLFPSVSSYILWYAKDKNKMKYRQFYEPLSDKEKIDRNSFGCHIEMSNGNTRGLKPEERKDPSLVPSKTKIFFREKLMSQSSSSGGEKYIYKGKTFYCSKNHRWGVSELGLDRLAKLGRLDDINGTSKSLRWKKYIDEVPGAPINNVWHKQMVPKKKRYAVETAEAIVERCVLMSSDPGDLVLDPTCGSGTTAFVSEKWGRRWITCDTSRVALALAKQRLITSTFDYFELADEERGVLGGFKYETAPNISASILAYDQKPEDIPLYNQPLKDKTKSRVSGPFTIEASPPPSGRLTFRLWDLITSAKSIRIGSYFYMMNC